jgi:hypothetical protein
MKTVGDVLNEFDEINETIEKLTSLHSHSGEHAVIYEDAIQLLVNYKCVLREIPIKK